MALKAFIDDSGSGGDSPWFVLAGYIGTAEAWYAFEHPWQLVLDGRPKLEYFKASEAESLRPDGQWAGVTKEERNIRIDSFISVVGKHATRAIHIRLKQKDYDEIIKPYVPPMWRNAYYFLFLGFLTAATSTEKYLGTGQRIEFFFDSNQDVEKPSRKLYGQIAMNIPALASRVEDIHYEDEKKFLQLQAADLLAWQIRRRFSIEEPARPQLEAALTSPLQKPFEHVMTRADLNELGESMDQHAMVNWAIMGRLEANRNWKRPKNLV